MKVYKNMDIGKQKADTIKREKYIFDTAWKDGFTLGVAAGVGGVLISVVVIVTIYYLV